MSSLTPQYPDEPHAWQFSIRRLMHTLLVVYATAIGLLPVCVFLQSLRWLGVVTALALAWAAWRLREPSERIAKQRLGTEVQQVSAAEYMLAATAGVFLMGLAGAMALTVYGLLYVVGGVLSWMDLVVNVAPHSIALYPGLFTILVFGLVYSELLIKELPRMLYPEIAGTRSVMYSLAAQGGFWVALRVMAVLGPAMIVLGLWALGIESGWISIPGQIITMYAPLPTWIVAENSRHRPKPRKLIEAIAKLFQAASFHVLLEPSSSSTDDLGPLLSAVDLIADGGDCAFVVQIRYEQTAADGASSKDRLGAVRRERAEAANLQTTAWTLSTSEDRKGVRFKDRLGIRTDHFQPLLVYAGIRPDVGLRTFVENESITMVEIDKHELALLRSQDGSKELAALVNRVINELLESRRRMSAEASSQ